METKVLKNANKKDTHKIPLKEQNIALHDKWFIWVGVIALTYVIAAIFPM